MALGLENKDTTRKPRCRPVRGRVASPPFPGGPICVPCLPLGLFLWAGPADAALATCPCSQLSPVSTPPPAWLTSWKAPFLCRSETFLPSEASEVAHIRAQESLLSAFSQTSTWTRW